MRIANRLLAVILALALIAGGVLVVVEVILAALKRHYWLLPWTAWTRHLRANSWQAGWVRTILIGLTVLGLVLLGLQLKRRRPALIPLAAATAGVEAGTTRRSLVHALRSAATEVDGVSSASAKVNRRRATVTAVSGLRDPAGIEEQVRERVGAALESLHLARMPSMRVRLRTKEGT